MWVLQHILEDANTSIKLVARKKNMKNITIRNVKIYVKNGWDRVNMIEIESIRVMMVRKPEYWRCYFDCQIHARKAHQIIAGR